MSTKLFCQIATSKIIVDFETKKPIPYVAIEIIENGYGIYSNEDGKFILNIKNSESLRFSHLGYIPLIVKNKNLKDTLFLKKNVIDLDEIIILSGDLKVKKIGYIKKRKTLRWHIKPQTQLATLIKYKENLKKAYLKKIFIPISKDIPGSRSNKMLKTNVDFKSVFRIHVYENNNDTPGINLTKKNILINCNQNTDEILTIDISDEFIVFPPSGIFIGIEMIGELDTNGKIVEKKLGDVLPSFMYTNKKKKNITSISFIKREFGNYEWEKIDNTSKDFSIVSDYNLAISLELSIYD
jgi:hypothetical protein